MKTKAIMIGAIVGLDMADINHAVFVGETIRGIEDLDAFIEYCRDKKNGITYSSKTEKLDTLATNYKKIQANAKLPHDLADSFTYTLVQKVDNARVYIKNEIEIGTETPFSKLKLNGDRYFTKKELNALAGLNIAPRTIIELLEQGGLRDELKKLYISKFAIKSKYDLLSDNQKKVQKLIIGKKTA